MAKVLKQCEFERPFGSKIYPWQEWLDGRVWKLTHGEDFDCSVASMAANARYHAHRLGGNIRTKVEGVSVTIQFYTNGDSTPQQ